MLQGAPQRSVALQEVVETNEPTLFYKDLQLWRQFQVLGSHAGTRAGDSNGLVGDVSFGWRGQVFETSLERSIPCGVQMLLHMTEGAE